MILQVVSSACQETVAVHTISKGTWNHFVSNIIVKIERKTYVQDWMPTNNENYKEYDF